MYIGVIHWISDPRGFEAAEDKALERGLPSELDLSVHSLSRDKSLGICIWRGESLETVRQTVEKMVGPYATNEYFELEVHGLS